MRVVCHGDQFSVHEPARRCGRAIAHPRVAIASVPRRRPASALDLPRTTMLRSRQYRSQEWRPRVSLRRYLEREIGQIAEHLRLVKRLDVCGRKLESARLVEANRVFDLKRALRDVFIVGAERIKCALGEYRPDEAASVYFFA